MQVGLSLLALVVAGLALGLHAGSPGTTTIGDALAVAAPMVAIIIALGFYPQPLIHLIEPAVAATMSDVGADPAGVSPQAPVEGTD